MNLGKIMKEKQGTVVDVRTPEEYRGGNVAGSINIPLKEIPLRIEELKNLKAPLVVCCASGIRSSKAQGYLAQQGIECYDAGSWLNYSSQTN